MLPITGGLSRPIDRPHPLRLVERHGIAMVDMGVILEVERDTAPVIGADGHMSRAIIMARARQRVFVIQRLRDD